MGELILKSLIRRLDKIWKGTFIYINCNKNNIIDEFLKNKNFNFDKNNIQYSWDDENYITEYCRTCNDFICSECKENNEHNNHLSIQLIKGDLNDNINI